MLRFLLSFLFLALVSAGTNQEGLDFLAKMKTEEGVIETPSGLLYKVRSFVVSVRAAVMQQMRASLVS